MQYRPVERAIAGAASFLSPEVTKRSFLGQRCYESIASQHDSELCPSRSEAHARGGRHRSLRYTMIAGTWQARGVPTNPMPVFRSDADAVASIDSNGAAKHPRGPTDQPESDA